MTLILGMTAFAVDIGLILIEKQKLSDALDAAALAGAQELPRNPQGAELAANNYAQLNGVDNPQIIIDEAHKEIIVKGQKEVPFYFARVLGFDKHTIYGSSKARVKPVSKGTGFVPLGVVQQDFRYGEIYRLKYGATDGLTGNYGALALGGTGATTYENNLRYGYNGELYVGKTVPTETGNMSGPTQKGIHARLDAAASSSSCGSYLTANRNCSRILYLPIIDSFDLNGRNEVTIVGFAAFYLEGIVGNGNDSMIEGRFIQMIFPGDWGNSEGGNYNLYTAKLVK